MSKKKVVVEKKAVRKRGKKEKLQEPTSPFEYDDEVIPVVDTFNDEVESDKRGMKYDLVAEEINKKFDTDYDDTTIREEMIRIVNKLFRNMASEHPKQLFQIVEVMAQEFKVEEEKIVRYLDKDNYSRLREFAKKNYETHYWETKERQKKVAKARKKGKTITEFEETSGIFED